jgi:hypothetical protein
MTTATHEVCGAAKASGGECGHTAGWGTKHAGVGRCRYHGGSSPNGELASERELARRFTVGMLGAESDTDALGSLVLAVRLAAGTVTYYRAQLAVLGDTPIAEGLRRDYERAVEQLSRVSKTAIDAGVAVRQVELEERLAERLASAAESALVAWAKGAGVELTAESRTAFARSYARSLALLEDTDTIEGTASDA